MKRVDVLRKGRWIKLVDTWGVRVYGEVYRGDRVKITNKRGEGQTLFINKVLSTSKGEGYSNCEIVPDMVEAAIKSGGGRYRGEANTITDKERYLIELAGKARTGDIVTIQGAERRLMKWEYETGGNTYWKFIDPQVEDLIKRSHVV